MKPAGKLLQADAIALRAAALEINLRNALDADDQVPVRADVEREVRATVSADVTRGRAW